MFKKELRKKSFFLDSTWIRTGGPPDLVNLLSKFKSEMLENHALWVIFIRKGALVPIGKNRMKLISFL